MESDNRSRRHVALSAWLTFTILFALGAGYCLASGNLWWILLVTCSVGCSAMLMKDIFRIGKRIRFVMDATLNGDFSYKFPVVGVNKDTRNTNETLNRIVAHFEHLTRQAKENDAFLLRVINHTDTGIALADAKGVIRFHNDAALRLLERPVLTHICQIPCEVDAELIIKTSKVTVNDRQFILYAISDLRRQMQVVEVESWEKLTRVLTHEIMNSLTPIQSIANTMSGKASSNEMTEALKIISSSSGSLMQFVKNFREFSLLPKPRMRVLYLKPLLESSIRMAENYDNASRIVLSLVCPHPEIMVYTDESLLSRVIMNILKNAIEASPNSITVEAGVKADDTVEIKIANDGEPIADETANHIFTPFFTTRKEGNGIGLSLSRRIVTHLGGTLSLKTRPITCFSIRL